MQISLVPVQNVDQFWPLIRDGMNRSCVKSGGQLSAGYLWQECRKGDANLYIVHDDVISGTESIKGAAIFGWREWANGLRYVGLGLCGKNASEWFEQLHERAKQDGKAGGAVALIDAARPGLGAKFYRGNPAIRAIQVVYEEAL